MHSGYRIPGIRQQQQQNMMMENHENSTVLLSGAMNQSHNNITLHQQNQQLPATQQLFQLDQQHTMSHHFLPVISNHHHYMSAAAAGGSAAFYPSAMNFKLGLSGIRNTSTNNNNRTGDRDFGTVSDSIINEGDAGGGLLVRGSEQYDDGDDDDDEAVLVPEARHCNTSLEIPHCSWHNPQDSSFKHQHQPRFWEPLPAEVSNENSDIVDRLDNIEMNHKQCSESKPRTMVYGELEAIYKRFDTIHQTETASGTPNIHLPSEASIEAPACLKQGKKTMKKNKRKERSSCKELVEFFEKLVKQVVDHQENLHAKFAKAIERLDGERRAREEARRSRELTYLEQEVADRVRERAIAASREDTIVSYLEKITGGKINLPPFDRFRANDRSPGS